MTHHFCTLFDSNYLVRGMALHESLTAQAGDFHLTVYCFDDAARRALDKLGLPNLSVIGLEELEFDHPELAAVKPTRSPVEYCWTATPTLPLDMFRRHPDLSDVTYVDADLYFFGGPQVLFDEMGEDSILITPHRYSAAYRHHQRSGRYNVQFMTFRNDEIGRGCLEWWRDRCLEWCHARLEAGRYGDQKYLDDWTERFDGVHVLQHKGGGLAPWNVAQYELGGQVGAPAVDGEPVIFFHYHGLRLRRDGRHRLAPPAYIIPSEARRLLYEPYLAALNRAADRVRRHSPGFVAGFEKRPEWRARVTEWRIGLLERLIQRVRPLMRLRTSLLARDAE